MNLVRLQTNNARDGVVGLVNVEDKAKMEASSVYKKSYYIKSINKRVKPLLGRGYNEDELLLRFVVVNMDYS